MGCPEAIAENNLVRLGNGDIAHCILDHMNFHFHYIIQQLHKTVATAQ